jgi:hypothetical protein
MSCHAIRLINYRGKVSETRHVGAFLLVLTDALTLTSVGNAGTRAPQCSSTKVTAQRLFRQRTVVARISNGVSRVALFRHKRLGSVSEVKRIGSRISWLSARDMKRRTSALEDWI